MDNTTVALATLAPKFRLHGVIIAGIACLHCQVRDEVLSALNTGEPIRRTRPYTTGDLEGAWFVEVAPVHDYSRLAATITCKDDVVREMLKLALANEPVYLATQDMTDDGGGVLRCTIAGARGDQADEYAKKFGTLVW